MQVLLDDGVLVRNGTVKLTKPLSELDIPPTVQVILASQIDRLPPDEKDLLQTLAVMGKEFPLGLIKKVTDKSDDELERMLGDLQLGEFIYEQPALPDVEYTFKHSLTLEVAYNSVLSERRRALHERTAAAIESLYGDRLDDHLAELAHQYRRGGNLEKAIEYLCLAGEQAAARGADNGAIEQLGAALELIIEVTGRSRQSTTGNSTPNFDWAQSDGGQGSGFLRDSRELHARARALSASGGYFGALRGTIRTMDLPLGARGTSRGQCVGTAASRISA